MATKTLPKTENKSSAVVPLLIGGGLLGVAYAISKGNAAKPSLIITTPKVNRGDVLIFSFSKFTPNSDVDISLGTNNIATITADAKGAGDGTYTIPNDELAGAYILVAEDPKGLKASATFQVTAQSDGWYAALVSIPYATVNFTVSSGGWLPVFKTLVIATANFTIASGGWIPSLTYLVQATCPFTIASGGFIPALTALVTATANYSSQVIGWFPALNAIQTASANYSSVLVGWIPALTAVLTVTAGVILPLNPVITLESSTLLRGSTLIYSLSGFPANTQITMTVNQYSIVVTTDGNGDYGPVNYPPTSSLLPGSYQLKANWIGNLNPVIANFTIVNVVTLNVTSNNPNGFVDCIDLSTGLDVPAVGTVPAGDTIQITAYAQNSNLYQFAGWTDPLGILDALQKMYPQVDVVASTEIYLIANFTPVSGGGGGGSGPTFPAPGTVGDGQYWMYIVFLPAYGGTGIWIGYDTYLDEYNPQDSGSDYYELSNVYGPYASGATS